MVNGEVVVAEETALDVAGTSKAQETRPSPSSSLNLRLVPLSYLLLLPRLPLSTPSSLVISRPPPSRSLLCRPHHSTQALIKLYLWREGLGPLQPPRPSSVLRGLSVPLTLVPLRSVPPLRMTRFLWIGLGMRMTWMSSWRNLRSLVRLGSYTGMCAPRKRIAVLTCPQQLGNTVEIRST